jgi:hypothetical protein
MTRLVDPTWEEAAPEGRRAPRPVSLRGATVGFLSNGKAGTVPFFDELERAVRCRWDVARVERLTKRNYSAPADADLVAVAAGWAVMFAGVGD